MQYTKIIELFGLPKTGKTIAANSLKNIFKENNYKAKIVVDRASVCPIKNKLHPNFNLWTTISLYKEVLEAIEEKIDFLIADRGILDAAIWINFLNKNNRYTYEKNEFELLNKLNIIKNNLSFGIFFYADINVVLMREFDRKLSRKTGIIMNKNILNGYYSMYEKIKPELNEYTDIYEIDTTKIGIHNVLEKIASVIKCNFLN